MKFRKVFIILIHVLRALILLTLAPPAGQNFHKFSEIKLQSPGLQNETDVEATKTAVPQMATWGCLQKWVNP